MARGSRWFAVGVAVLVVVVAATALVLRSRLRCAGFAGPGVTAEELPTAPEPGRLRLATFNLRSFPLAAPAAAGDAGHSPLTNICDLEDALGGLGFDLAGFAEVADTRRFPPILKRATDPRRLGLLIAPRGGRSGQRVALAWDQAVLEAIGEPQLLEGLEVDADARPGLALTLAPSSGGPVLTVAQVHLADGPAGLAARRRQVAALVQWLEGVAGAVVVMGDFNPVGGDELAAAVELAELDRAFAALGLERLGNATGCTAYLEAPDREPGELVPALLDLVYSRGLESRLVGPARSWLHCARAACGPLQSGPGFEDGTFHDVSDHCPVTFELGLAGPAGPPPAGPV